MHNATTFSRFVLSQLLPFSKQQPIQYFKGEKGIQIAYQHFVQQANHKLMILVNGRRENLLKWTELAYEFYHQGYDVLIFDHRGQGFSERLLKDKQKGYVENFNYYVEDMANLINSIHLKFNYRQQYIVCHSLGGLITSNYLAYYPHQINKVVFSSPFFGVPLKRPILYPLVIQLMNLLGQGKRYVFGKGEYQPVDLTNNPLTSCPYRMRWQNRIYRRFPQLQLGDPTFFWLQQCLDTIKKLPNALEKMTIPTLILQAELESVVDNQHLARLVQYLPDCRCKLMQHAKHEILFEQEPIRRQAITHIQQFLAQ